MKKLFCLLFLGGILGPSGMAFAEGYYFHQDHLGGSALVTNEAGEIVAEYEYYPYGEGYSAMENDFGTDYKFTGQEEDEETGLYYYGARYYNPEVGRFMGQDPAVYDERLFENLRNPQALNSYSYVLNNPIKYIDPNGEEPNKTQAGGIENLLDIVKGYESKCLSNHIFNLMHSYYTNRTEPNISTRYLYTKRAGWIDLKHFFASAKISYDYGAIAAELAGYALEIRQSLSSNEALNESAFSYEDLSSNTAGAIFGEILSQLDASGTEYMLSDVLNSYFEYLGIDDPNAAINYNDLPENFDDDTNDSGDKKYSSKS